MFKMRMRIFLLVLASSTLATAFFNCSKFSTLNSLDLASDPMENSESLIPKQFFNSLQMNSSIRYFGFFGDGAEGVGSGDYIQKTSKTANLHLVSAYQQGVLIGKIQTAKSNNSQVLIVADMMLFNFTGKATVELRSNYKEILASLHTALKENQLLDTVLGFYVYDEPYWRNKNANQPLSESQVHENLRLAADAIKDIFGSQTVISASEAYPTLQSSWIGFPDNYDWLAINCYLAFGSICDSDAKYIDLVEKLKSKMSSNQKLFFTLDNYWGSTPNLEVEKKLLDRTVRQQELASENGAVALISFLYQSHHAGESLYGLEDMPNLLNYVETVASSITGKVKKDSKSNPIMCGETWEKLGEKWCDSGIEYQRICSCIPPGHLDPKLWVDEGKGCYSHMTGKSCKTKLPACIDWKAAEVKLCVDGVEWGRVSGCLPPGYDNPFTWITESNGSFLHQTGRACSDNSAPKLPVCADWKAVEVKTCRDGIEYGRVSGCLPEYYDNPIFWVTEADGTFTHRTGRACNTEPPPSTPAMPNCPDWRAVEVKSCRNGVEYGRIQGCLPEGYQNPALWVTEADGSFTHMTGQSCQ